MLNRTLKRLRKAKGLSQSEVARRADIRASYIVMLENGSRKNPSLETLSRIAKAIGVPLSALLGDGRSR